MSVGIKLLTLAAIVLAVSGYLAYLGGSSSWNYYLHVDECLGDLEMYTGRRVRVNGRVAAGSLEIRADRRQASFALTETGGSLPVQCRSPLPNNLAEGIEVVVEGVLESGPLLVGDKVITRCASKYESDQE